MRAFIGTILAIGLFVAVIWPGFLWGHPVWGPWGQTNVDMCVNFEGIQTSLPTGYIRSADGVCTPVTGGTTAPPPGGSTSNPGTAPVAPPVVAPPVVVAPPPAAPAPIGQCISRAELEKYFMIERELEENGMLAGVQGIAKVAVSRGNPWWMDATHVGGVDRSMAAGTKGSGWIQAAARCPAGYTTQGASAAAPAQAAPANQPAPAASNPVTQTQAQPQAGAPSSGAPASASTQQIATEVTKYLAPSANAVHDGKIGGYQGKIKTIPSTEILQVVHVDKGGTRVLDPKQLSVGEVVTVWLPDAGRPYPSFETLR